MRALQPRHRSTPDRLRRAAIAFGAGFALCIGANLAFDFQRNDGFAAVGDLVLTVPFALLGFYALVGVLRGRALRLAWFVQAILTLLAWSAFADSSDSLAAIVFWIPLFVGPAVGTIIAVGSTSWRAGRIWRAHRDDPTVRAQ